MNDVKLPKPCPVDEVVGKVILAIDMPKEEGEGSLTICFTDGTFLFFEARIRYRNSIGEPGLFEETQDAIECFGAEYLFACKASGITQEQFDIMRQIHYDGIRSPEDQKRAEREIAMYERLKAKYGPQEPGTSTR